MTRIKELQVEDIKDIELIILDIPTGPDTCILSNILRFPVKRLDKELMEKVKLLRIFCNIQINIHKSEGDFYVDETNKRLLGDLLIDRLLYLYGKPQKSQ